MNFMEYVCRGIVRSEDAIRALNKRTIKLARACRQTNSAVLCFGVVCLGILAVVSIQDSEIKALQKQVSDLSANADATNATEERNQQEGA